jgi:hypothetical protein
LSSRTDTVLFWAHHGAEIAFLVFIVAAIIFQYQAVTIIPGAEEVTTTVATTTTTVEQSTTSCQTHPCTITENLSETIEFTAVVTVTLTKYEWIVRMRTAQAWANIFDYLALATGLFSFSVGLYERRRSKKARP